MGNHVKHGNKELEQKCIQTNISVYNNLCACLLQQPDSSAERIKELAEVVIELDKSDEKAWYRHGQGCVKLKDFETARESFSRVAELSGGAGDEEEQGEEDVPRNVSAKEGPRDIVVTLSMSSL